MSHCSCAVAERLVNFGGFNDICGTAEARVVKFYTHWALSSPSLRMTNHPNEGMITVT